MVDPPSTITVTITTREVAVSIDWRASDTVFLIAKAKAIAPRRPEEQIDCLRQLYGLKIFIIRKRT